MSPDSWNVLIVITTVWSGLLLLALAFVAAAARGHRRSVLSPVPTPTGAMTAVGHVDSRLDGEPGIAEPGIPRHIPRD